MSDGRKALTELHDATIISYKPHYCGKDECHHPPFVIRLFWAE